MKSFRIRLIQLAIHWVEQFTFYRALYRYYKSALDRHASYVILDVGSNKGQSIDFFLKLNAESKVYGFEPNPSLYKNLVSKYRDYSNIRVYNCGISNRVGELLFYENILDETSSFEKLNSHSTYLEKKANVLGVGIRDIIKDEYIVQVDTLSHFIQEINVPRIDLIKIDVEGHEYQCLEGLFQGEALYRKVRFIQIESHNDDMYQSVKSASEIADLLKKNGFYEVKRIKHAFGDFDEIIYANSRYEA
jgi:FkbM family methyltransferase